jgi:molybdenum cofactor cytidylyltransferase
MQLRKALHLEEETPKPIIALTGAGGKSTLLFKLGHELAGKRQQVMLTSTTRLWAHQKNLAPFSLIGQDPALLAKELPIALRGYRQVLVMARPAPENKLGGLAPEAVCLLAGLPDVQAAVVEADGSRERPIKAPADHEPVMPVCATHVITVASVAAVNQPLTSSWVHRPDRAASLTGLHAGDRLNEKAAARLLLDPRGGLKGHLPAAQSYLYLNLTLTPNMPALEAQERRATARRLASRVLRDRSQTTYRAVLIGNATSTSPVEEVHARVAGIVLAAGQSQRFGPNQVKQLLPWGPNNTLLGHVVDTALAAPSLDLVIVVTGHAAHEVGRAIADRPVTVAVNPGWRAGQSSSLQTGLSAARASSPLLGAALFLLADQPDVTAETIEAMIQVYRQSQAPVVAPIYQGGTRGNPVLFDNTTFPELQALTGDVGGRPLIERLGQAVHVVTIDLPQPMGIETMEDYRQRVPGGAP